MLFQFQREIVSLNWKYTYSFKVSHFIFGSSKDLAWTVRRPRAIHGGGVVCCAVGGGSVCCWDLVLHSADLLHHADSDLYHW